MSHWVSLPVISGNAGAPSGERSPVRRPSLISKPSVSIALEDSVSAARILFGITISLSGAVERRVAPETWCVPGVTPG